MYLVVMLLGILIGTACSSTPDRKGASSDTDSLTQQPNTTNAADTVDTPASFTEMQWGKLDHALKLLFREGPDNPFFTYQISTREDGERAYGVLLRASNPEALAEANLPLGNPSGEIVTGRLTLEEIRRATRLDAVVSISNPSEATSN